MCFVNDDGAEQETYDDEEINEFYYRHDYDESYKIPKYYHVEHFLSQRIFACINVQGLGFSRFRELLIAAKDYSGYQLKVMLNASDKKPQ